MSDGKDRLSTVAVHTSESHPPHLAGTHMFVDEMLEHQEYISNSLRGISTSIQLSLLLGFIPSDIDTDTQTDRKIYRHKTLDRNNVALLQLKRLAQEDAELNTSLEDSKALSQEDRQKGQKDRCKQKLTRGQRLQECLLKARSANGCYTQLLSREVVHGKTGHLSNFLYIFQYNFLYMYVCVQYFLHTHVHE